MAYGRPISLVFDVARVTYLNAADGTVPQTQPAMSYLEKCVAQITFVNGSLAIPMPIANFSTGICNIDNLFLDAANLAISMNSSFVNVAGDWPTGGNSFGGTADPSKGQISIRLDGNSPNALAKLGPSPTNTSVLVCRLEFQAFDGSGNLIFVRQIPFNITNLQDPSSGTTPVPSGRTWIDAGQIAANYVPIIGALGSSFIIPGPVGTTVAVQVDCDASGHIRFTTLNPWTP